MVMRSVLPPTTDKHPDRFLQRQEAIADAFSNVALEAVRAGWHPEEVASAMVELADHVMLGMIANRDLVQDLSILRRR
jgi:predicted transcriptional regulator